MYKLLLVTDKEEIRDLYRNFPDWETLGFERPTIESTAQSGIEKMKNMRFDTISWLLSIREGKQFFAFLKRRPEIVGMETVRDEQMLRREISSARRLLSSRDASRQMKRVDDLTRVMQGDFFCDLLRGAPYDQTQMQERFQSLKLDAFGLDQPVVMSSFRLPQGDYFLAEVWRYGRERLENALKNIFEHGDERMAYVLLIINPHHMRLLGLPLVSMSEQETGKEMESHLERCKESLEAYFELALDIKRIVTYENLYALGRENMLRAAH